jgi:hypothetical protein
MSCKKETDPNWTPKNLILFERQQKLAKGEKLGGKLEGDKVKHLRHYTTNPTTTN